MALWSSGVMWTSGTGSTPFVFPTDAARRHHQRAAQSAEPRFPAGAGDEGQALLRATHRSVHGHRRLRSAGAPAQRRRTATHQGQRDPRCELRERPDEVLQRRPHRHPCRGERERRCLAAADYQRRKPHARRAPAANAQARRPHGGPFAAGETNGLLKSSHQTQDVADGLDEVIKQPSVERPGDEEHAEDDGEQQ